MIQVHSLHTALDISIETIALQEEDVFNNEPHTHSFWEIGFFEEGQGVHTIDFIDYPIQDGTLYFLKKGIVHTMFRQKGSFGKVILFSDEALDNSDLLQQLVYSKPHVYLNAEKLVFVKQLFAQLSFFKEAKYTSNFIRQSLHLILTFFERHASKSILVDEKIHAFLQYIETHFSAKLTIEECATNLNMSYQKLHTEVQKKLGKSPLDIIQERIILQAKRLLFNTQESVKQIAYSLDFEDTSYFSKYFKNHVGCSPIQFRLDSRK